MRYIFLILAGTFASIVWMYNSSEGGRFKHELKSSAAAEYSFMPD